MTTPSAGHSRTATGEGEPAATRPTVLAVDDTRANLVALEALFAPLDVELVRAASGDEALAVLLQRDVALVLMDIHMPGLDGFQTTALIRQRPRNRHTPIIFVTAIFTDEDSIRKAYQLGALDYLTKPFDQEILKAKVAAVTDRYRQDDVIARQARALHAKQQEAEREHAARRAAEAANRAKDEFLAVLSHELRAPLNAIVGWASLLATEEELPVRVARAVDAISRNAQAQARLVDQLIDASHIVNDKLGFDVDVVDFAAAVQDALAAARPAAGAQRVKLELRLAPGGFVVDGDRARLEQLVASLVSNAVKFSLPDGVVDVDLSRDDGGAIRLAVADRGLGISAELLPHVFESFRLRDSAWTRRHGGLGLGLTIARSIAEQHGGKLEAFSDGEGHGATFVLTLPPGDAARAATAAATAAAKVDTAVLGNLKILVVDDDGDSRELMAAVLEDAGTRVVTAASVADAVRLLADGDVDVLVSDLGMPEEDGLSLIGKVRAGDRGKIVAVAVSGYGSYEDRQRSLAAGFDAHLTKPCDRDRLLATLVGLVAAR